MTFKSHEELVCWQLSVALRDGLIAVLAKAPLSRDVRFCEDLSAAVRSASANIAEGFGRSPGVFCRHLDIATGSLREAESHLDEALVRRYLTPDQHRAFRSLAKRAFVAARRLAKYLGAEAARRRPTPVRRS